MLVKKVACKRFLSNSLECLCGMILIVLRFPLQFQSHVCYLVCEMHKQVWIIGSYVSYMFLVPYGYGSSGLSDVCSVTGITF